MTTTPTKSTTLPEDVKSPKDSVALLATTLKDTVSASAIGQSKVVKVVSSKTGVDTYILVWASGIVAVGCILMGWGVSLASTLIGFLYPCYASVKALDSEDPALSRKWLTYWIAYGCFTVLECCADYVLYWLPFYNPMKIGFLLFLMMDRFQGSNLVVTKAIQPAVSMGEEAIGLAIDEVAASKPSTVAATPVKEEAAAAPKTATTDFYDTGGVETNTTDAPNNLSQRAAVEATDMD